MIRSHSNRSMERTATSVSLQNPYHSQVYNRNVMPKILRRYQPTPMTIIKPTKRSNPKTRTTGEVTLTHFRSKINIHNNLWKFSNSLPTCGTATLGTSNLPSIASNLTKLETNLSTTLPCAFQTTSN